MHVFVKKLNYPFNTVKTIILKKKIIIHQRKNLKLINDSKYALLLFYARTRPSCGLSCVVIDCHGLDFLIEPVSFVCL